MVDPFAPCQEEGPRCCRVMVFRGSHPRRRRSIGRGDAEAEPAEATASASTADGFSVAFGQRGSLRKGDHFQVRGGRLISTSWVPDRHTHTHGHIRTHAHSQGLVTRTHAYASPHSLPLSLSSTHPGLNPPSHKPTHVSTLPHTPLTPPQDVMAVLGTPEAIHQQRQAPARAHHNGSAIAAAPALGRFTSDGTENDSGGGGGGGGGGDSGQRASAYRASYHTRGVDVVLCGHRHTVQKVVMHTNLPGCAASQPHAHPHTHTRIHTHTHTVAWPPYCAHTPSHTPPFPLAPATPCSAFTVAVPSRCALAAPGSRTPARCA